MKSNDSDLLNRNRYRALLGVSTAVVSQPDVRAILHSISALLSKVVAFDSISLLLLNQNQETAQLYALEAGTHNPDIKIGTEVPFKNTSVETALEKEQPVFVQNTQDELLKIPQFAQRYRFEEVQSAYIFPIFSARRKLGVLIFGAIGSAQYSTADIELMGSVTAHVSVALESALAFESAEAYRRQLERERDKFRLLLEINNHIITHLDVNELFRAASRSIREYFKNAFTGFWLFGKGTYQLQRIALDFPDSRGFIENIPPPTLTDEDIENMRTRMPNVFGPGEIKSCPEIVVESLRAESIVCLAHVPLIGSADPLGAITLGSRQKGAFGPSDLELLVQISTQISLALENALAYGRLNVSRNRLEDERLYLESELRSEYDFEDIIGKSPALRKVLEQVSTVAPTDSTVLLTGETGTGKELIARAIHNLSPRKERTFVRLNCAAIPSGLMESELFGHEKGAFTGALTEKRGRIELAHEGSLFLDEVGDLDPDLQPKLLRVLQEREFERLGSNRTVKVDVRLIAATNHDLMATVRKGEFREDLYYRLSVFPIHIPPLRERREDIPLLSYYFVSQCARKMRKNIRVIPREVLAAMMDWSWPGNVRELQNFIERSVILTRGETLAAPISELKRSSAPHIATGATLHAVEREAIVQALRSAHGRISGPGGAAELLGLKRTTLQRKMQRLEILRRDFS
jgi:formate hydrogenlyase transcriptional activator